MAAHELRFYGGDDESVQAVCTCRWVTFLEGGHSLAYLNRLAAQHTGTEQEMADDRT